MKILVLGASGMLGSAMLRVLHNDSSHDVYGSIRSEFSKRFFSPELEEKITPNIYVEDMEANARLLHIIRPEVVINCIGLVKQLDSARDPIQAIRINALFPHLIAQECKEIGSRFLHFSTDCVFSGRKGNYLESDEPDALDLYGRSKLLGEVDYPHAITLRTSIIGHQYGDNSHGITEWFLAQVGPVRGYTHAFFSGLPTCELAAIVNRFVLPRDNLHGLYHVASNPISKFELLGLMNDEYGKCIKIVPDDKVKIDRSLDGTRFNNITGYEAPNWTELVARMRAFH